MSGRTCLAIVLAAGEGTRMQSSRPKVLHVVAGRTLLGHVLTAAGNTAMAVVRFKNGALGNVMVSNSQNPAINCRVSVHGANGASVGVQTDDGLKHLKDCKNLEVLTLNGTKVTDEGLKHLKDLKTLKSLSLPRATVSAAAVAELKKSLPGCSISR